MKDCCRTVVRSAADLAGVLYDKGLPEARAYAMVKLGKWDNLTAEDRLQALRYEVEFQESQDPLQLWQQALDPPEQDNGK